MDVAPATKLDVRGSQDVLTSIARRVVTLTWITRVGARKCDATALSLPLRGCTRATSSSDFGRQRRRAVEAFDTFVRDGAREKRRPDFAGEALEAAQASAVHVLGNGIYVGDGVLGDEAFLERVSKDVRAVEGAMAAGPLRRRLDDRRPPHVSVDAVVQAVCEALKLDRMVLEVGSQERDHVMARRLVTWVWVTRFGGRQVEVARELKASRSVVARWFSSSRAVMAELDSLADDVVHRIVRAHVPKHAAQTRVRFEVGVNV